MNGPDGPVEREQWAQERAGHFDEDEEETERPICDFCDGYGFVSVDSNEDDEPCGWCNKEAKS